MEKIIVYEEVRLNFMAILAEKFDMSISSFTWGSDTELDFQKQWVPIMTIKSSNERRKSLSKKTSFKAITKKCDDFQFFLQQYNDTHLHDDIWFVLKMIKGNFVIAPCEFTKTKKDLTFYGLARPQTVQEYQKYRAECFRVLGALTKFLQTTVPQ